MFILKVVTTFIFTSIKCNGQWITGDLLIFIYLSHQTALFTYHQTLRSDDEKLKTEDETFVSNTKVFFTAALIDLHRPSWIF